MAWSPSSRGCRTKDTGLRAFSLQSFTQTTAGRRSPVARRIRFRTSDRSAWRPRYNLHVRVRTVIVASTIIISALTACAGTTASQDKEMPRSPAVVSSPPASRPAIDVPAGATAEPLTASFVLVEPNDPRAEWDVVFDSLDIDVEPAAGASGIELTVSLGATGTMTLAQDENGFSVDQAMNATPYWHQDSPACAYTVAPGQRVPYPLGVTFADLDAEPRYSALPYCGLNWLGYNIKGPNEKVLTGESVTLVGEDYSFTVEVPAERALEVIDSFVHPAGWMFSYGQANPAACASFGLGGDIDYSTTNVCG